MKTIKVICGGCSIAYTENNTVRYTLKTAQNGPFECEDEQADRLVMKGVAVYVGDVAAPKKPQLESTLEADLDAMSYNDLKKLAAMKGLKADGNKKADYIAAIIEATETDEVIEDDELPDLSVADPE